MNMVKESSWKACNWGDTTDRQPSKKWKKKDIKLSIRGLNYEYEQWEKVKKMGKSLKEERIQGLQVRYSWLLV